jgi:hypothetical protein
MGRNSALHQTMGVCSMLYDVKIRATQDLAVVDWAGAMRCSGSLIEVPAKDEDRCRARVRLVTERAFRFPMEPLVVIPKPEKKFVFRRELPLSFNYMVSVWLVSHEKNSDEARAMIWDAMDGGSVRVASVKGPNGFCEVEVVVTAKCEEHAEGQVRDRLTRACLEHGLEFVPFTTDENAVWVERRLAHSGYSGYSD